MEKFEGISESGIEKIRRVQGVSPEREEQMLSYFAGYFEGQRPDPKLEREKTPEEQEVLEGIVASMPDFIQRYGGEPIVLKPEYMHVIDPVKVNAEWPNMTEGQRAFIAARKDEEGWTFGGHTVGILSRDTLLREAHNMVHEFLHLQSFTSFTQNEDAENERLMKLSGSAVLPRQSGMEIHAKGGKNYFRGLSEAIIEELTMRFDRQYFQDFPPLEDVIKYRAEIEQEVAEPKYEDAKEISEVVTKPEGDGYRTTIKPYVYGKQRRILRSVISKIYDTNEGQYPSKEVVFELFAKAELSGRLLEVARIIEQSLGKGSFRKLGEDTALTKGKSPAQKLT
jgi:hypothetical protein